HRERAPDGRHLKRAPHAALPDLARPEAENRFASEDDVAAVGGELAIHHVEAGGLAGAVRADEGEELALADREADVVDGAHDAEGLAQVAYLEERRHRARRFAQAAMVPARPSGKMSTRTRITTPSTPRQYGVERIT